MSTSMEPRRLPTRWSPPSLPALLDAAVKRAQGTRFAYLDPPTDDELALIPATIARLEAAMSPASEDAVMTMIGKMALLFPAGKLTGAESAARLELYLDLLGDLPADVLSFAFREVAMASRFFPTVAEIREAAEPMMHERRATIAVLRSLLMKAEFTGMRASA